MRKSARERERERRYIIIKINIYEEREEIPKRDVRNKKKTRREEEGEKQTKRTRGK